MADSPDTYLSTAVIVGRHHPLTQPLSKALFNVQQKVFLTDVPALHSSKTHSPPPPRPDVRAWVLWCSAGEFHDHPSDGDLKDRSRRIVGSVQMMGACEAVVVTDFSVGEVDYFRDEGLQFWREWTPEEMQSFLNKSGVMRTRLVAYFQLVRQMADRQIPIRVVHCGSVTGDSETGEYEHNPALENLFENLWNQQLNVMPGNDEDWLPGVSSDFAAAFLARLPMTATDVVGSYWLYDRRGLPLSEVITNAALDLGRPVPSRRISRQAMKVMEWTGMLRRLGVEAAARRVTRKRFDCSIEYALSAEMGLQWPERRASMRKAAEFFLKKKGVDVAAMPPPVPKPRKPLPDDQVAALSVLPRSF